MSKLFPTVLGVAALLAVAPSSNAAEVFAGVYGHDLPFTAIGGFEEGAQLTAGVRGDRIESLRAIGRPQAYAQGAVNTSGGLNFATAGLSWRFELGSGFYVQPGIGAAVHDGVVEDFQRSQDELNLGSRLLCAPELSLGRRFGERWGAELSWIHLSHGQRAGGQNPGLDEVGVRITYALR